PTGALPGWTRITAAPPYRSWTPIPAGSWAATPFCTPPTAVTPGRARRFQRYHSAIVVRRLWLACSSGVPILALPWVAVATVRTSLVPTSGSCCTRAIVATAGRSHRRGLLVILSVQSLL